MPSPGDREASQATGALRAAREHERAGCMAEAIERYETAIAAAEQAGEAPVLAEALRRLAILVRHRDEPVRARDLCQRSYEVALRIGSEVLAAEALNTLGGLDLAAGSLTQAAATFTRALELGEASRQLRARVQQNLGIVANIQGELNEALARYERSLAAYRDCGDEHGCAIAYHNLGMVSADRGRLGAAECYFRESLAFAERVGDVYLQALCLVNQGEVAVRRQRFEDSRQNAERALALFDQVGARGAKADAYRVIGMVYRETGRHALAESRLRSAIELAVGAGSVLNEAEASRELALLYQASGRNQEALRQLSAAHRLFRRLDARVDLVHVDGKVAALENTYLAVVRAWGESLESSDSFTFGHCERVAGYAAQVTRLLELDDAEERTVLLGAYLHDVGMVRVPHEILYKAAPLTPEERAVVELHPIWGVELLADVEFPWDLKAIIRSHHEHYDGSGYPDRLVGDAIPLAAQIVGIADLYDTLTTARGRQRALGAGQALQQITNCRHWWSGRAFDAFVRVATEHPGGMVGAR